MARFMFPDEGEVADPLTVALIRALNSAVVSDRNPDWELIKDYGYAAQPIADAIRQTIREEVARALHDV